MLTPEDLLIDICMVIAHLFKNHKALDKWVKTATPENILPRLTKAYLNPKRFLFFSPLLTPSQLSLLQKNLSSKPDIERALSNDGFRDCISFYAGYPFAPIPIEKMGREDWVRAVIGLSGRDNKALGERDPSKSKMEEGFGSRGRERILFQQGRTGEDRLRLLFSSLAHASPNKEDILDALYLCQPRPDDCWLPYGHTNLLPIVERWNLELIPVYDVRIPREKLVGFGSTIGFELDFGEGDVGGKGVGWEKWLEICGRKPGVIEALKEKAEELFLS